MRRRRKKLQRRYSLRALRIQAYHRQQGLCYWCKQEMIITQEQQPRQLTADHYVPQYAGGKTQPGNIVAACRECNSGRNTETNRPPRRRHHKTPVLTIGNDQSVSPFEVLLARTEHA